MFLFGGVVVVVAGGGGSLGRLGLFHGKRSW